MAQNRIFQRFAGNPVLTADDFPDGIMYVLNPGAVYHNGEYILLVDAVTTALPIVLWIARSKDGIHFKVDPEPVNWPQSDPSNLECCVYDPRITKIDDDYIIMYASNSRYGVRVGIVKTRDFLDFERVAVASEQGNRNAVLFPERFNGRYARLDRPMGDPQNDPASIWISYSDDLIHWGNSKPLLDTRFALWDCQKIGAGAVPIKTKYGWLVIYHGVSQNCSGSIYRLGVCLLDLADPSTVIARGEDPVFWPEDYYEIYGNVNNVVFTANAILESDDTVRIYYGAADTCIGMAEAKLENLVSACYKHNIHLEKFFSQRKPNAQDLVRSPNLACVAVD